MSTKVFEYFVEPLRRAFDDPFSDMEKNNELFFRLNKALDHFSVDTLQQAVVRLQNVWQSRKFPTQAACVAACVDVHEKKVRQTTEYPVIYVNTLEWQAWEAYYCGTDQLRIVRLMNRTTRGVWTVPTQWPQGHEGQNFNEGDHDVKRF